MYMQNVIHHYIWWLYIRTCKIYTSVHVIVIHLYMKFIIHLYKWILYMSTSVHYTSIYLYICTCVHVYMCTWVHYTPIHVYSYFLFENMCLAELTKRRETNLNSFQQKICLVDIGWKDDCGDPDIPPFVEGYFP